MKLIEATIGVTTYAMHEEGGLFVVTWGHPDHCYTFDNKEEAASEFAQMVGRAYLRQFYRDAWEAIQ